MTYCLKEWYSHQPHVNNVSFAIHLFYSPAGQHHSFRLESFGYTTEYTLEVKQQFQGSIKVIILVNFFSPTGTGISIFLYVLKS